MSEPPQDLKPRTKAFALRVIRMYSKLPKNDTVSVQNHPIRRLIRYTVISKGTECGIYRAIEEDVPGSQTKTVEPLMLICRYDGDSIPDASIVVADMKATVTRAISAISQKIQSGY